MKWFHRPLKQYRVFVLSLLLIELFDMAGPRFLYADQEHRKKEERRREISDRGPGGDATSPSPRPTA